MFSFDAEAPQIYILENQDEAKSIGFKAREKAMQNYSIETVGEKLRKTYEEICSP